MKTIYILKENNEIISIEPENIAGSVQCSASEDTLNNIRFFSCLYIENGVLLYDKQKELPLLEAMEKYAFNKRQKENRHIAYTQESDPINFMMQRGQATKEQWEAKIAEIVARYPYQE